MPGRNRARRLELTLAAKCPPTAAGARSLFFWGASLLCVLSVSNCGFPDYGFPGSAGASGEGASGGLPAAGFGNASSGAGAGGSGGAGAFGGWGAAGEAGAPEAGSAGVAGAPPTDCEFPAPLVIPAHCFDHVSGEGETGKDCGGECPACTRSDPCVSNSDCASGVCQPDQHCSQVLSLTYSAVDATATTRAPTFNVLIDYKASESLELSDLRIRYYFNHNDVAEPVLGLNSLATWDPGNSQHNINGSVRTQVYRRPPAAKDAAKGLRTDSYLEISFSSPIILMAGTRISVTQDFVAGSGQTLFLQASHYSFQNAMQVENDAITVYAGDRRVWGVEPPLTELPACAFAGAVNIGGPALTIADEAISAESDVSLSYVGTTSGADSSATLRPVTDASSSKLLKTWRTLNANDTATWNVADGSYWAYVWLTSVPNVGTGTLLIQAEPMDTFVPLLSGGRAWALVGPYPVDVSSQTLELSVAGSINVAGIKLYRQQ